jgi:hypothetical protein
MRATSLVPLAGREVFMHFGRVLKLVMAAALVCSSAPLFAADFRAALKQVLAVGPKGEGNAAASAAAKVISQGAIEQLPDVLGAMDDASPLALNWLRLCAEAIAQRHRDKLPAPLLERFVKDTSHGAKARRLAFEFLCQADATAEKRLVPGFLNDPSLELRREAVAKQLADAAKLVDSDKAAAIQTYRKAFTASRDLDQVKAATEALKKLGEDVDLPLHFGFLMTWRIIGPFDNVNEVGWDQAYPPEKEIDLTASYDGKKGKIKWIEHTTTDPYGVVDLTVALDKHKGAVAYAYAEFISDKEQPAELRLGCVNANKLWLNGELLTANHVYHSGTEVDQFKPSGKLKAGKNAILLKICQNEQTEAWAQDWRFQLRVCDHIGTPIFSQDRPGKKVARR